MDGAVAARSGLPRACRIVQRGRYADTVSDISVRGWSSTRRPHPWPLLAVDHKRLVECQASDLT